MSGTVFRGSHLSRLPLWFESRHMGHFSSKILLENFGPALSLGVQSRV